MDIGAGVVSAATVATSLRASRLGGLLVSAVGVLVLAGWASDLPELTRLRTGWDPMKVNTAVCCTLLGAALGLFRAAPRADRKAILRMLAGVSFGVAALSASQDAFGWSLGIDEWLFVDRVSATRPGRMGPGTALLLMLVAVAIVRLDAVSLGRRSAQWLGLATAVTAAVALCGYLYGVDESIAIPGPGTLSAYTAFCLLVLGAGVVVAQPRNGVMLVLSANTVGGTLARRLLPMIVVVPVAVGWACLVGTQRGLYDTASGLALFTVSNILALGTVVWIATRRLIDFELRGHQARVDLTEHLERSQRLLQTISDNSPAVIYAKDLEGRYLLVNRRFTDLFQVDPERLLGRTDDELFSKAEADRFRDMDRRTAAAGVALTEEEAVPLDDGVRTYLSVKAPLRDETGKAYAVFGISTDITDRKRMEQALVESQQTYQALAESLPHLVWTCRPDGYCDFLSRQWVDYTGRPADEQLGYGWAERLHPDDRDRVQREWAAATVRGDLFDIEFRIRRTDGVYRWFKTRAVPLRDATGHIVKWFGSNTDFDDFKRAEQRLEAQLERLSLLDRLTRAIGERQDLQSILQVVVRSLEDQLPLDFCSIALYDHTAESLIIARVGAKSQGLASDLALSEKARVPIDRNGLSRCVRGHLVYEPDITGIAFPFPQRLTRGGLGSLVVAPLIVESNVFGVLIAARRETGAFSSADCEFVRQLSEHVALAAHQAELYTALQRAYDDLRQTQQAVMQQERLKALGQMASGIAHDINNAISPIVLYTESLLETEPQLSDEARTALSTIQRAVEDVAQTVARMREFYREREPQLALAPVHVNRLIHDVVGLTRARWSDMPQQRGIVIRVSTDLATDDPVVLGLESEIREALINLVFNAIDAMPEGGTLIVRTRTVPGADRDRPHRPDTVHVEVTDTGTGMDADTRRRCLEPFFTTKGERGTGLGLAMVYGTVQRHNADIDVDSRPGQGTTVRLIFNAAPVGVSLTAPAAPPPRPARLRLLIVDDDPLLLKSLGDVLERDSHVVTVANGGQAGIDTFRQAQRDGRPFDLVITDLGMPYVDGRQVASTIKQAAPDTPLILLTGWGQRLVDDGEVPPHVDRVLSKPPKLPELRLALAALTTTPS